MMYWQERVYSGLKILIVIPSGFANPEGRGSDAGRSYTEREILKLHFLNIISFCYYFNHSPTRI